METSGVSGEVKVWRFDGKVERASRDQQGEWTTVALSGDNFGRFVRHSPLRAMPMNEDFIVLDRDGHWQTGRRGDYVVLDDGYLRVETSSAFSPQHHQIPESRLDLITDGGLAMARHHLAAVMEDVLATQELPLDADRYQELAHALADAAMATVATL